MGVQCTVPCTARSSPILSIPSHHPPSWIDNWLLLYTHCHTVQSYIIMGNPHTSTTTHRMTVVWVLLLNIKMSRQMIIVMPCCLFCSVFPRLVLWSSQTVNNVQHREIRRLSFMMCGGDRIGSAGESGGLVAFYHYWINKWNKSISNFTGFWYFPPFYILTIHCITLSIFRYNYCLFCRGGLN